MATIEENPVTVILEERLNADESGNDDEEDYTGYFLEPIADAASIAKRVAEANRQLYLDETNEEVDLRRRRVQFSDSVVNFEAEQYEPEFGESDDNSTISEEDENEVIREENEDAEQLEEKKEEEIVEEVHGNEQQLKVLLVMLPREQSSSCESVIGEDIALEEIPEESAKIEDTKVDVHDVENEDEPMKKEEVKVPKLMRQDRVQASSPCKVSKISPDLNYSRIDTKPWKGLPYKKAPKEPEDKSPEKPHRRNCCLARTGLPKYNGLRSEYGLSAEQLQERKRKTFEMKQQSKLEKFKKRQEELRRKLENELSFRQWLLNKKRLKTATAKKPKVDTLTRSDVYIQNHAIYASRSGVSYSVEYSLIAKKKTQKNSKTMLIDRKQDKPISFERLFENVSPHVKNTYQMYSGGDGK